MLDLLGWKNAKCASSIRAWEHVTKALKNVSGKAKSPTGSSAIKIPQQKEEFIGAITQLWARLAAPIIVRFSFAPSGTRIAGTDFIGLDIALLGESCDGPTQASGTWLATSTSPTYEASSMGGAPAPAPTYASYTTSDSYDEDYTTSTHNGGEATYTTNSSSPWSPGYTATGGNFRKSRCLWFLTLIDKS